MCLLNVRSIGDDVKSGKITDMMVTEEPAIVCTIFTETWLWPDQTSTQQIGDITPPPRLCFSTLCQAGQERRWGGVLLKSSIKVKILPLSTFESFEYIDMSIVIANTNIHWIAIYRTHCPQKPSDP